MHSTLTRIRLLLALFIVGLVASGLTAFPLLTEMNLLVGWLGLEPPMEGIGGWLLRVRDALEITYARFPFLAYGYDWLAFGHLVIALFFIGPLLDPVRNVWVLRAGLIACAGVIPTALICGAIRGIPLGWQLIDCSFGVLGAIPLALALVLTRRLAAQRS